jgi:hypothetical protein
MRRQLPGTVVNAVRVLVALVVLAGVTTLLMWLRADDLILSWGRGNAAASEILEEGGLAALKESPITPSFVPVAVVSFVVFALLALVLGVFVVEGHNWARISLSATVAFGILLAVITVPYDLPALFVGCVVVGVVLCLAELFFLWHKATNAYFRDL